MADKYIRNVAGTLTETEALNSSAGVGSAGKIPALDSTGRLASNMMPVGFGDDVKSLQASENIASGDLVNVHNVTGSARIRKADAATSGKEAHGFVLSAITMGASGLVYFEGANTAVTGLTPGPVFLSATAGLATSTAPSASGNVVQRVGFATSETELNFQSQQPIVLA